MTDYRNPHPLAVALQHFFGDRLERKGLIVCSVAGESSDAHIRTTLTLTMPPDDREPIIARVTLAVAEEG
jgi:hypothetical protein